MRLQDPAQSSRLSGLTVFLVLACSQAFAQTANYKASTAFLGTTSNNFKINYTLGSSSSSTWGGRFETTIYNLAGTAQIDKATSYCVDLFQFINAPDKDLAYISPQNSILAGSSVGGSVDRNIGAAAWLVANSSIGVNLFALVSGTQAQKEAALQFAIWEATFDGGTTSNPLSGGPSFTAGNFKASGVNANSSALLNMALVFLNQAFDASSLKYRQATGILVNYSPPTTIGGANAQDQLIAPKSVGPLSIVPEPSSLALSILGAGLLFFLGINRRFDRR